MLGDLPHGLAEGGTRCILVQTCLDSMLHNSLQRQVLRAGIGRLRRRLASWHPYNRQMPFKSHLELMQVEKLTLVLTEENVELVDPVVVVLHKLGIGLLNVEPYRVLHLLVVHDALRAARQVENRVLGCLDHRMRVIDIVEEV